MLKAFIWIHVYSAGLAEESLTKTHAVDWTELGDGLLGDGNSNSQGPSPFHT